ncbi:MAG: hypothetical protein HY921_10285 [Elusimicrobia bacterium]|nr:hypothetical protein [Elusimicrobiota bacterium]
MKRILSLALALSVGILPEANVAWANMQHVGSTGKGVALPVITSVMGPQRDIRVAGPDATVAPPAVVGAARETAVVPTGVVLPQANSVRTKTMSRGALFRNIFHPLSRSVRDASSSLRQPAASVESASTSGGGLFESWTRRRVLQVAAVFGLSGVLHWATGCGGGGGGGSEAGPGRNGSGSGSTGSGGDSYDPRDLRFATLDDLQRFMNGSSLSDGQKYAGHVTYRGSETYPWFLDGSNPNDFDPQYSLSSWRYQTGSFDNMVRRLSQLPRDLAMAAKFVGRDSSDFVLIYPDPNSVSSSYGTSGWLIQSFWDTDGTTLRNYTRNYDDVRRALYHMDDRQAQDAKVVYDGYYYYVVVPDRPLTQDDSLYWDVESFGSFFDVSQWLDTHYGSSPRDRRLRRASKRVYIGGGTYLLFYPR